MTTDSLLMSEISPKTSKKKFQNLPEDTLVNLAFGYGQNIDSDKTVILSDFDSEPWMNDIGG